MTQHLPYFILSANGNNIILRQEVDREVSNDGLMLVPARAHGDTNYWFVQAGLYQIRRGTTGTASIVTITAIQTATLT